jgi:fibronectin-binding autotransporter adhesin
MRNNAGIFVALLIVAVGSSVRAATVTWLYGGDGDWNTASNWSSDPSLPGVNDDVIISQPGLVTVSLSSGTAAIHSLVTSETLGIQGGTLSLAADSQISGMLQLVSGSLIRNGNLTISGDFLWAGGSMTGSGNTSLTAGSNTTIFGGSLVQELDNAGYVTMTGQTPTVVPVLNFAGGTFNNLAGGTFEYNDAVTSSATILVGKNTDIFNNAGEFNFSSLGNKTIGVQFNNSGALNVYSGNLVLSQGGANSGVINLLPGAALNGINFINRGTVNIQGNGSLSSPFAGTNASDGKINIASGLVTLQSNGTNSGEINIAPDASLTLDGITQAAGSKITGLGALTLRNLSSFGGVIQSTGPISFISNVTFTADQDLKGPVSLGTPSAGVGQIMGAGNVLIENSLNWTIGSMSGAGKTTLGPDSINTFNFTGSSSLSRKIENYGTVNQSLTGGALSLTNTASITNFGTYNLNATTGSTAFSGSVGKFSNVGTLNVNPMTPSGTISMGVPLDNSGIINMTSGVFIATINNTGTINVLPAVSSTNFLTNITNAGVINFSASSAALNSSLQTNTADGTINVLRGTLTINNVTNAGKINISQGATLALVNASGQASGSSINGAGALTLTSGNYLGSINVTGPINLLGPINFNSPQNIPGAFTITNGSVAGTANVTLAGPVNWVSGTMQGPGKTSFANTAIASVTAGTLARTLDNAGQLNFIGTQNFSISNGALNNLATGTVNIRNSFGMVVPGTTNTGSISNAGNWNLELLFPTNTFNENVPFSNSGVVNVSSGIFALAGGGTNTGSINVYPRGQLLISNPPFVNRGDINFINGQQTWNLSPGFSNDATGEINVLAGKLTITGFPNANAGKINVAAGAQFATSVNYPQLAGSSINGAGDITLGGVSDFSGALNTTGDTLLTGPVTFNADQNLPGTLIVRSNIDGPGSLVSTGEFLWQSPNGNSILSGVGKIRLEGSSVFGLTGFVGQQTLSKLVENVGVLNWNLTAPFAMDHGALNNLADGIINLNSTPTGPTSFSGFVSSIFNNYGTINKLGAGTVSLPLNNHATVNVQQGGLSLSAAQAGTFNIAEGASLTFSQPVFDAATSFAGSGNLLFTSNATLPGPNTFSGIAKMVNGNTLQLANGLALQNSTLDLTIGKLDFGTLVSATLGSLRGAQNINLQNQSSGNVALSVGKNNASDLYSGKFIGGGSFTKIGTGTLTLAGANTYSGTTTIAAGTLLVSGTHTGGATYTVQPNATLGGVGNISADVVLQPGGSLAPGASPGKLTIGSLSMGADSSLNIELGGTTAGTGFDQLNVTGAAALAGTLKVSFVNSFVLTTGASFDLLDAATITGSFTHLDLPQLGGAFVWNPSQLYATGVLSVVETFVAGDLNRDGQTTAADLPAFLSALANLESYETSHNLTAAELLTLADFDGSGSVTNADLQSLLDLIAALPPGNGALDAVPEPASLLSASLGLALLVVARLRRAFVR